MAADRRTRRCQHTIQRGPAIRALAGLPEGAGVVPESSRPRRVSGTVQPGVMYANGQGVQRSAEEASKWFLKAARRASPLHSTTGGEPIARVKAAFETTRKPSGITKRPSRAWPVLLSTWA